MLGRLGEAIAYLERRIRRSQPVQFVIVKACAVFEPVGKLTAPSEKPSTASRTVSAVGSGSA
jgi:hypothetical protein